MKTFLLSIASLVGFSSTYSQYSQNFEGPESSLAANCWTLAGVYATTNPADIINGVGSMYTNPPTNGSGTRDIYSPALNVSSTSFTVSFNYKVSSKVTGNATRTIEIGLMDIAGNFISLDTITMDKNTDVTAFNYNNTFTLDSTGIYKLVLKLGGAIGDGNSRLIFDDIYTNASPWYSGGCNTGPVAVNDNFTGETGNPVSGDVQTNDYDPNGELIFAAIVDSSADGVVVLNADGSFTFTPYPGFTGNSTSFTYQLTDNGFDPSSSNIATVTLYFANSVVLPVKLIHFTARLNSNKKVDLTWSTASEMNASHYVVERSFNGRDYTDAGIIFAAGNSASVQEYQFSDAPSINRSPIIYYKLRLVDSDDKINYSATRIIQIGKQEEIVTILTFPNPVANELRITIPNSWQGKKLGYEIINSNGQLVSKTSVNESNQTETIALGSLSRGMYIVKVTCENGETAIQRIVKQ